MVKAQTLGYGHSEFISESVEILKPVHDDDHIF